MMDFGAAVEPVLSVVVVLHMVVIVVISFDLL